MGIEEKIQKTEKKEEHVKRIAERIGDKVVEIFQLTALFIIGAAIVWSATLFLLELVAAREVSLHDILMLFIYLELGAMVGIYFRTDKLPVEFLLYITITVMTRKLISAEDLSETRIMVTTGAVLLLAIAVLLLRYGVHRFPSGGPGYDKQATKIDSPATPRERGD